MPCCNLNIKIIMYCINWDIFVECKTLLKYFMNNKNIFQKYDVLR